MKGLIIGFICSLYLCGCTSTVNNNKRTDTIQIVKSIFNSDKVKAGIPNNVDTIYVIKSHKFKFYNKFWPVDVNQLKIVYIEESKESTEPLIPGSKITDRPIRYVVTKFSVQADSASASIYGINHRTDYNFKFVKKDDKWIISHTSWQIE
jgi:hypothetical protein